jgi:hypothetical protein
MQSGYTIWHEGCSGVEMTIISMDKDIEKDGCTLKLNIRRIK